MLGLFLVILRLGGDPYRCHKCSEPVRGNCPVCLRCGLIFLDRPQVIEQFPPGGRFDSPPPGMTNLCDPGSET